MIRNGDDHCTYMDSPFGETTPDFVGVFVVGFNLGKDGAQIRAQIGRCPNNCATGAGCAEFISGIEDGRCALIRNERRSAARRRSDGRDFIVAGA